MQINVLISTFPVELLVSSFREILASSETLLHIKIHDMIAQKPAVNVCGLLRVFFARNRHLCNIHIATGVSGAAPNIGPSVLLPLDSIVV